MTIFFIQKSAAWMCFEILHNSMGFLVSSISGVFCHPKKDLGLEFVCTKNQLVSWPNDKEQSPWSRCHRLKFYYIYN